LHDHTSRKASPSDLSDAHWEILEPWLPSLTRRGVLWSMYAGRSRARCCTCCAPAVPGVRSRTMCRLANGLLVSPALAARWHLATPPAAAAATSAPAGGTRPRTKCGEHRESKHPHQSRARDPAGRRRLQNNLGRHWPPARCYPGLALSCQGACCRCQRTAKGPSAPGPAARSLPCTGYMEYPFENEQGKSCSLNLSCEVVKSRL
jgi:hypothetical protein